MRPTSLHAPLRATRLAVVATVVAVVVAVTGFEAAVHAHVPAVDGWHDATPHGPTAREEGLNSCSICRLAHETASGPVAPGTVSEPLRLIAPRVNDRSTVAFEVLAREHSPRAPPCLASC
jgi:hypothetical protein